MQLRFAVIAALSTLVTPGGEAQRAPRAPVTPLAVGTWSSRGPGGGGALYSPVISSFDPDEIFLMTDMTGVFHTVDFGERWQTLDFRQIQGDPLGRVELTSDRTVLYALSARGERRVLEKSTDAGATFHAMPVSDQIGDPRYLFADPDRADTFVTADRSTIYVSRDGGSSLFAAYTSASTTGCVLGGAFFEGDAIYVGANAGLLVMRGDQVELEVDSRPGIPANERIVSFAGGGNGAGARLFALTYGANGRAVTSGMTAGDPETYASIYALDPGADSWRKRARGIDGNARLGLLAMAQADPETVYAAGKDSETDSPVVYATTTAGETWKRSLRTAENENVETGWSGDGGDRTWTFGEVALGLAVAPRDPKRVIFSDLGGAHASRDGGGTWQAVHVAAPDRNRRGSSTPKGLAYATSGIEPTSVWALAWPRPGVVFADLSDIQAIRSSDGGETWRVGIGGVEENTTYDAVVEPESGALYVATSSVHDLYESPYLQDERIDRGRGGVMVSMNGGASFHLLHDFGHPVVWLALDPANPRRLLASVVHSREGGIYAIDLRTSDTAADRAPERLPAPPRTRGHPYTFHVLGDGAIVASYSGHREPTVNGARGPFVEASGVFVLRAGASAWEDVSLPAMHYWTKDVVVDPHDPSESTWYVGVFDHTGRSGNGGLYRTRDRGRTWDQVSREPRVESCTLDPANPSVLFMTTETHGLFVTRDLQDPAPVFHPVLEYPFRQPLRLFFNPANPHELWATSFGGGLRATLVE
ncbi:MAG: hypothetical protein ACLQVI_17485 [Polyangiaceae bacterium]